MSDKHKNKKISVKNYESTPEDKVAKGEDQFMFGYSDAERLDAVKTGLAERFITSSARADGIFHKEYIKGFISFISSQKKK